MAQITIKGEPIKTCGDLPQPGNPAPDFKLIRTDLSELSLKELLGKRVVLNVFPSIDTPVCATSVRRFNEKADSLTNTTVLCVSMDLPFAHKRFCGAEGLKNVVPVSDFRDGSFGRQYGVRISDGALSGLLSRAVVIVNENGKIVYAQQVPEITQEPDYEAAVAVLS